MQLFAAAARWRRGELIKGKEGDALVRAADLRMRQEGIQNPERIAGMLVPGHWS